MERFAGTFILLWGWRRFLAAFLAGAFAVLALAPFDFFAACFVAFPILVWLLDGAAGDATHGLFRRLRPAFATGWWFGFGYFAAGLWWIGNALLVEADSFAWALPLAVLGLPAVLALFYGLAAAIARLFWTGSVTRIAALALGFGIAEWLRTVAFTGFPWNAIGYAAMPTPFLMQPAALVGLHGMNVLAVFVFAVPALLAAKSGRRSGFALAILLIALDLGFGAFRLGPLEAVGQPERVLSVRLVQPSIAQDDKSNTDERDRIFKTYLAMSAEAPALGKSKPSVIVWPETSVPFLLTTRPDALAAIGAMLDDKQTLLAGAVRAEGDGGPGSARYYNSLVVIDGAGEIADAADKLHLVPFGEYLPFEDLLNEFGVQKLVDTPVSFSPGQALRRLNVDGVSILPLICYEIIFPGAVGRDAQTADLIVNVTNDAWYGDTPGPYQHFRQAQLRAVETGVPVIRSANNGLSGVIDSKGRVRDGLAFNAVGVLDADVPVGEKRLQLPGDATMRGLFVILLFAAWVFAANVRQWRRSR